VPSAVTLLKTSLDCIKVCVLIILTHYPVHVFGVEASINYQTIHRLWTFDLFLIICTACRATWLPHHQRDVEYLSDSTYRTVFRQLHTPAVDLVSDPPTQPPMSSPGAEPSSASAISVMPDPLLGTVFRTTFTKSMTTVFLSVA